MRLLRGCGSRSADYTCCYAGTRGCHWSDPILKSPGLGAGVQATAGGKPPDAQGEDGAKGAMEPLSQKATPEAAADASEEDKKAAEKEKMTRKVRPSMRFGCLGLGRPSSSAQPKCGSTAW